MNINNSVNSVDSDEMIIHIGFIHVHSYTVQVSVVAQLIREPAY